MEWMDRQIEKNERDIARWHRVIEETRARQQEFLQKDMDPTEDEKELMRRIRDAERKPFAQRRKAHPP